MTESTETVRVFIVEDDKDFIFLIEKMLERQPEITVIGSCSKKEDAVKMVCALQPQIVINGFKLRHFRSGRYPYLKRNPPAHRRQSSHPDIPRFPGDRPKGSQRSLCFRLHFQKSAKPSGRKHPGAGKGLHRAGIPHRVHGDLRTDGSGDGRLSTADGKNIQLQSSPKTIANQKTKILRKLGLESQKDLMHLFRLFRD